MTDPYAPIAPLYDLMAGDPGVQAFYAAWRTMLLDAARARGAEGAKVLVDLACGTGNSTIPWTREQGWSIIGVDRSAALLKEARRKSRKVRWIQQDLAELALDVKADFATCHFDALNHVLETRVLGRVFKRVARLLRPGGLFLFDLSTEAWFRWLNGRDKLFHAGPHYFTATNAYDAATGVATFQQHWFVRRGRLFEHRLVSVQERAFTDEEVTRLAAAAGLVVVRVEPQVEIDGEVMRKIYLVERPARSRRAG